MLISGYKHEKKKKKKKKKNIIHLHVFKTKMSKRELILEAAHIL